MRNHNHLILIGSDDISNQYCTEKLNQSDLLRLQLYPEIEQRIDWKSSRFLKQQLPTTHMNLSLTHKKGYAGLIASSSTQCTVGIDLEYAQDRNFLDLVQLCCTESEQRWLANQQHISTGFYQLWTLKEAFIKAYKGQLMDLSQWSLIPKKSNTIHIPTLNPPMQAHTCIIEEKWFISVVYPAIWATPPKYCTYTFGRWKNLKLNWHRWPSLTKSLK